MKAKPKPNVTALVISLVCETCHVTRAELLSRARPARIAWPRQVAMALSYECSQGVTLERVGAAFGRDHSTVMVALTKVADAEQLYPKTLGLAVAKLRERIQTETQR